MDASANNIVVDEDGLQKWKKATRESYVIHCKKFQERAKDNAFAHRFAMERATKKADVFFVLTLTSTVMALFFTTLAYLVSSAEVIKSTNLLSKFLTESIDGTSASLISIVCSFIALFSQSFATHKKYDTQAKIHEEAQQIFNYISQRSRDVLDPSCNHEKAALIVDSIEREFSFLKSRTREPKDKDFRKAHEIQRDRKKQGATMSFDDSTGDTTI